LTPKWMMWLASHTPTWLCWPLLVVLTQAGAVIGTVAADLYGCVAFEIRYFGRREKWKTRVEEWKSEFERSSA
jgi:hypothetical protein